MPMQNTLCLLIDDDSDDREIFIEALKDIGKPFDCITAENGLEALNILKNTDRLPDFIFLDLNMPIMSGKQCLQEIKKIPAFNTIPVIIYTTSAYSNDIEETKRLGAAHFVSKPSSIAALTNIISRLLSKQEISFLVNTKI
jgi:CheY-like chemotaxis protein